MASYGYGQKTFVQGVARLARHLAKYITTHDTKLRQYLPPAVYTCVAGLVPCLLEVAALLNQSAG